MSIESGEVHDWPPVTSAHASRGQPDATRSLAVRPVASIQSALLTARPPPETPSGGLSFRGPRESIGSVAPHLILHLLRPAHLCVADLLFPAADCTCVTAGPAPSSERRCPPRPPSRGYPTSHSPTRTPGP